MPLSIAATADDAARMLADAPSPVVVVPVYNAAEDVEECISSLLRHTPAHIAILVIDDASPDAAATDSVRTLGAVAEQSVVLFRHEVNTGFVGSCNDAFAITAGRDVVLVNSDVVVADGWLTRMVAAAGTSNTVATVSTLSNHGTILSVPRRNEQGPLPTGITVDDAAARIAAAARCTRPVIPTGIGHCLLITRTTLDVIGGFDPVFAPGYGEEVDFCQRAVVHGFIHVVADDVFVHHKGGSSFGVSAAKRALQQAHEDIINERYPMYADAVREASTSTRSALARALSSASRALVGSRVAIDGFCLGELLMGTQRFVLETAIALAEQPQIAETHLYVNHAVPDYVVAAAGSHPRLRVHRCDPWVRNDERYDAVVRPYQVDHPVQLQWMRAIADVSVVTQLDLIAYHNPAYFPSASAWQTYRHVTEQTFDAVDGVAFISHHSLEEAAREGLLTDLHQRAVTYCGLDHRSGASPGRPSAALAGVTPGFLLVLGASYLHKNRPFALELLGLLAEEGFEGSLVMAGAVPPNGSSAEAERAWLAGHPHLDARVLRIGGVAELDKAWLLANAGLVVYPTLTEGFGMVPFEAAAAGTPVLTTRQGALDEVLPPALACAPSLRPADNVRLAQQLLDDAAFRDEQVALLQSAAERFTWHASAAELADLVQRTLQRPAGRSSLVPVAPRAYSRTVELAVRLGRRLPRLKRIVIGEGTRRQAGVRRFANWLRRRSV